MGSFTQAVRGHLKRIAWLHPFIRILEAVAYGTRLRELVLEALLRRYHLSRFRRDWVWTTNPPHFEDHHCFLHLWNERGERPWPMGRNPDFLARGLHNRELIRPGDVVLNLCCGDGFFDYYFYSGVAGHVDGLDLDGRALCLARRNHSAPNITYHATDCIAVPFPREKYDRVFWDGALAHFEEKDVHTVMEKIRKVLPPGGILAGSEALENPEHKTVDHHQAFPEPPDLRRFLMKFFPYVVVKEIPPIRGRYREAYFRCSDDPGPLRGHPWS
jgi:SAM-dependent methyltransferase